MSVDKLKLEVLLNLNEKVVKPLKAIAAGSGETAKALKSARDQLKELNAQQERLDAWKQTAKNIGVYKNMLAQAEERVKAVAVAMKAGEFATKEQQRAFKEARQEANELKMRLGSLHEKQQRLRTEFAAAGHDTRNLVGHQKALKSAITEATAAVTQQSAAYEAHKRIMQRYGAARAAYEKTAAQRARLENSGTRTMAVGAAIGLPVAKTVKDYATFEDAMLGVARQVDGARDGNGKLTPTYYEMGAAIKSMSERIPMATTEIAKIVEAGARMGIQGKKNLLIYAETTAVMAQAFDLPADKLGEDIAKVAQLFKVPIQNIGAMGDAINYLDDNALAKGGDIIEVMKRIGGTAAMVNMNFKEAAALGSTFLSLGAAPEVAATASNAMMRELSIATMQTKRFRDGLKMLKLDAKSIQLGMNKDATGTIFKVLEAIKSLPKEKQLEAATRMFGKEYGDDAAKLAENLDEYRKQLKLVNEAKATGSMQREGDARKDTINARLLMAKNTFFNLSTDLGESLRPTLVATLEHTLAIVQAVRDWASAHPALASGIMQVVKWLAIGVTLIGGFIIAASAVLAPLALLKLSLGTLGVPATTVFATLLRIISPVAKLAAAFTVGYQAGSLLAAGLDSLISYLVGYKTTLGAVIFDLWQYIKIKFVEWIQWLMNLPGRFMAAGAAIIEGLISGISSKWESLKGKMKALALLLPEWMRKPLDINSPSRVFAKIGVNTMEGLEKGVVNGQQGPLSAIFEMSRRLAGAGAGVMMGGAAMAGELPRLDARPPLNPMAIMSAAAPAQYVIHVHPSSGMDEAALARLVAAEIDRRESARAASRRSRLTDLE